MHMFSGVLISIILALESEVGKNLTTVECIATVSNFYQQCPSHTFPQLLIY